VTTFLPTAAPLVLLIDGTRERRWGRTIRLTGRYDDAVRSQTGHVATSAGIQWLCRLLLVPSPWSTRSWARPVMTVPTRSPGLSRKLRTRHRTTPEYAEIVIALVRRASAAPRVGAGGCQRLRHRRPRAYRSALRRPARLAPAAHRPARRPGPAATQRPTGCQAEAGAATVQAYSAAHPPGPDKVGRDGDCLVRRAATRQGVGDGDRPLVSGGGGAAAPARGSAARPVGQTAAVRPLLHGSGRASAPDQRLVRRSVGGGGHLRGSPGSAGLIWASRRNGTGTPAPSAGRPPAGSDASASSSSSPAGWTPPSGRHDQQRGMPKRSRRSPTRSPPFVAACGPRCIRQARSPL
jgi:hypothetical protein